MNPDLMFSIALFCGLAGFALLVAACVLYIVAAPEFDERLEVDE